MDQSLFEQIAIGLERDGFVVIENGLPSALQSALTQQVLSFERHEFSPAGVGRGDDLQLKEAVRSDKIAWIDASTEQTAAWLAWTDELRQYLNKRLFLGLFSFESLFAKYLPGDFYLTHVDAFHGASNRILSLVTYLNDGWQANWGGELVLYDEQSGDTLRRVLPQMGTLVLFLSEEFPHEVLPTLHTRYSVAGWFRVNTSINNCIDPPS